MYEINYYLLVDTFLSILYHIIILQVFMNKLTKIVEQNNVNMKN